MNTGPLAIRTKSLKLLIADGWATRLKGDYYMIKGQFKGVKLIEVKRVSKKRSK